MLLSQLNIVSIFLSFFNNNCPNFPHSMSELLTNMSVKFGCAHFAQRHFSTQSFCQGRDAEWNWRFEVTPSPLPGVMKRCFEIVNGKHPRTISFLSSTNSLFLSLSIRHITELKCHPPAPSVGGEEGGNYVFPVGGFQRGKADSVSSRGCKAARWHATSGGISKHFLYQLSVCCPTVVFRCANVCFRADSAVRIREVMFVQRGDGKTNQHFPPPPNEDMNLLL